MSLPRGFLNLPLAHRGLHGGGAVENGRAAVAGAIAAGYGIEIDVQGTADGQAVVFHDDRLERLTGATGAVRARDAADLVRVRLAGTDEPIPLLPEILALVAGRAPLLIEIKDQTGAMGDTDGTLERAVARALAAYRGSVAVMSFNPRSVARMADLAPDISRGLTTGAFGADWELPDATRTRLRGIADYGPTGACFISHEAADLGRDRVAGLQAGGAAILCWTIRSEDAERQARRVADNITFEGYRPALPA